MVKPIIIIYIIIIVILTQILLLRINYTEQYKWWGSYGGNNYSNYINFTTILAYYYNPLIYYFSKTFSTPSAYISPAGIRFLHGQILPYRRYYEDNIQKGTILPRHLCESVLFKLDDNDDLYTTWYKTHNVNEDIVATYKENVSKDGIYTYTKTNNGVYPSSNDIEGWRGLISEWCGDNWVWKLDTDNLLVPTTTNASAGLDTWYLTDSNGENTGRGDNFLARLGINPDSPLVISFCNGKYNSGNLVIDASAMKNLINPIGQNAGGWVGFIQQMDSMDKSVDDFTNYIRTDFNYEFKPKSKKCSTGKKVEKGIFGALTSSIPIAVMSVAAPEFAPFILGGAAIVGGISGYQSSNTSC